MKKASTADIFEPEKPAVPADWDVIPFEKAAQIVSDRGKRVKQGTYLPAGKVPVIDQGQSYIGGYIDDDRLAFEGQLPVVLFGDHTRSVKYVDKPFAVGAEGIKILRPADCYQPKFFYYLLQSLQIPSRGYSRHFQFLRRFQFPVAPPDQQTRIIAEIEKQFSRLDEAVANLNRVKANLKRYKAAVLKAAVEGKLTEEWRKAHPETEPASELLKRILAERQAKWKGKGKYREPVGPVVATLPTTPGGWAIASLEQLTSPVRVICYGILMPKKHIPDGVLYVKVRDFKGDKIDVATLQRTSPEIAMQYARASLKVGDLLLAIRGTYGRVAEVPPELEGGNITQDTARLAVTPLVDRRYVAWFLRSEDAQNYFKRVARGVAVKGVNIGDVRPCPVLLPPPTEQKQIVAEIERRLSVVEELETVVEANFQRGNRLRQSVLQRAFSGKMFLHANSHGQSPNERDVVQA